MGPFAALERFFERLFERPSARLFHTRLQPIQLQRRVERAMENGRLSSTDRVVVPNRYIVRLSSADLGGFGDFADSLELELADAALRFARVHHYTLSDRPAVRLTADPTVAEGDARIDATFSDGASSVEFSAAADGDVARRSRQPGQGPSPNAGPSVVPGAAVPPSAPPLAAAGAPPVQAAAQGSAPVATPGSAAPGPALAAPFEPAAAASPGAPAPDAEDAGIRAAGRPRGSTPPSQPPQPPAAPRPAAPPARPAPRPAVDLRAVESTRTMIFQVPTVDAPLAVLREIGTDGSQRRLTLDGGPVTIGRATDNNLVLRDSRVSRYHGRLAARQGALVYSDLGSTNGSRVNGVEVDEVVLGAGDRIELGDTVLVVESVARD